MNLNSLKSLFSPAVSVPSSRIRACRELREFPALVAGDWFCLGAAQGLGTQKYFGDNQSEMKMLSQQGEGWVSSAATLAQASVPGSFS